jgi:four helix bundle protein
VGEARSHRDLIVWQKAMDVAVQLCQTSRHLPRSEAYGLMAQLTRAAASVPANIAEGNPRGTAREYAHFLAVAKGSLVEAETYLLLAVRLSYLREEDVAHTLDLITEVDKMLTSLRAKLKA